MGARAITLGPLIRSRGGGLVTALVAFSAALPALAFAALDLPLALLVALPAGLAVTFGVLFYPFVGLLGVVGGSQIAGLLEWAVPSIGDASLEILALLVMGGLLVSSHRQPRAERFGPDALPLRLAALFLLAALVSALFASSPDLALVGVRKRFNLLLLMWLVVRMTDSVKRLRLMIVALVLANSLSTGLAVVGWATGFRVVKPEVTDRLEDPDRQRQVGAASQNATTASRMMLAGTALAAVLALRERRKRLWVAGAGLGLVGTLLTFSRSTSIVLVLGGAWWMWKLRRHRRFPLLVTAAILGLGLLLAVMPAFYFERLAELRQPSDDPTLGRRLGYQLIGLDLLRSHPVLGVGPDNYRVHYLDFDYRFMPGRFLEARELHNMYLSVTVETGVLGIACFAAMLGATLFGLVRVMREQPGSELACYAEALLFTLSLFLATCVFGAVETNKLLWVLLGLGAVVAVLGRRRKASAPPRSAPAPAAVGAL